MTAHRLVAPYQSSGTDCRANHMLIPSWDRRRTMIIAAPLRRHSQK